MDILCIEHLLKSFRESEVIKGISLSVPEGSVYGFIGENGAGKTTTMKIILGLLKPDGGKVTVCNETVRFGMTATNRHIGYLPDVPEFYNYMRPKEYLRFCGEIAGLTDSSIGKRSDYLLDVVGLKKTDKKIGGFSRGMKQRLGVASALINSPKLLICDEPTSALDPVGRKEVLDILGQIRGKTTVIFSTHILSDVERICDHAAVLHNGKIVLDGTLSELKAKHKKDSLFIDFLSVSDKALFCEKLPREFSGNIEANEADLILHSGNLQAMEKTVLQILSQNDIMPRRFEILAPTIENLFLEAVQ